MYQHLQRQQQHQRIYAQSILELNEHASKDAMLSSSTIETINTRNPSIMTIALPPNGKEVSHLETSREGILEGVRQGFARAYDALVEDPKLRGNGPRMALHYFPDEILDYDPTQFLHQTAQGGSSSRSTMSSSSSLQYRSAFEQYLESSGVVPKAWLKEEDDNRRISNTTTTCRGSLEDLLHPDDDGMAMMMI